MKSVPVKTNAVSISSAVRCHSVVSDCRMVNDAAPMSSTIPVNVYEVRPRKDKRGVRMLHLAATYSRPAFWRYRLPQDCRAHYGVRFSRLGWWRCGATAEEKPRHFS